MHSSLYEKIQGEIDASNTFDNVTVGNLVYMPVVLYSRIKTKLILSFTREILWELRRAVLIYLGRRGTQSLFILRFDLCFASSARWEFCCSNWIGDETAE